MLRQDETWQFAFPDRGNKSEVERKIFEAKIITINFFGWYCMHFNTEILWY